MRRAILGCVFLTLSCSRNVEPSLDGAADSSAPADSLDAASNEPEGDDAQDAATDEPEGGDAPTDAGDSGPPTVEGRVLVLQQTGVSPPTVWTRAWFTFEHPCPNIPGSPDCACTDKVVGGCLSRSCEGRARGFRNDWLLGYAAGDGLQIDPRSLDAGPLTIRNGTSLFTHETPYDAHDLLSAPWQAGDAIGISAAGLDVPHFSVDVPFPPAINFLEPDLSAGRVVLNSDTLNIRWTAAQGPGSVEAIVGTFYRPDASFTFTVVTCSAPVEKGVLAVPVPGETGIPSPGGDLGSGRALAVRVINRALLESPGLTVDAVVASFDTGPLYEAPPTSDGGAGAGAF